MEKSADYQQPISYMRTQSRKGQGRIDPRTGLKLFSPTRIAALLLLPVCLLGLGGTARGDTCNTYVGGIIIDNWTSSGSPYCVTSDVQVAALTIHEGVTVKFCSNYIFRVDGVLQVMGTSNYPVLFTPADTNVGWQGIFFYETGPGQSFLNYAIIEGAKNRGLSLTNSTPGITNCTIRNNASPGNGGGIIAYTDLDVGNLALDGCILTNNSSAGHGGGIYADMDHGALTLRNCLVANNTASGWGGGLCAAIMTTGDLNLEGCSIVTNRSRAGGGGLEAELSAGTLRCQNTTISGNIANYQVENGSCYGGGIAIWGNSELVHCDVVGNTCYSRHSYYNQGLLKAYGGGIFSTSGRAALRNCLIASNYAYGSTGTFDDPGSSAASWGGGLFLNDGSLRMDCCIVSSNLLYSWWWNNIAGGGVSVYSGTAALVNCTVTYNQGSGLHNNGGTLGVTNAILFYNNSDGDQVAGAASVAYSDVQSTVWPGPGNISRGPMLCLGNQSLITGSPCIDAGDPDPAFNDVCIDNTLCTNKSRGTVRNDMGAYGGPGACPPGPNPPPICIGCSPSVVLSCLGQSATLFVTAGGSPPLTYQWWFNNTPLFGQTNSVLVLTNLHGTDAGPYWAVVSNTNSSTICCTNALVVNDACIDIHMYAGLTISGQQGATYVLKYTTDLGVTNFANWTPLATNTMGSSDWFFLDMGSPYSPYRFYGAKLLP